MLPLVVTGLSTLGVVFVYLKIVRYVFRLWRSAPSLLLGYTTPPYRARQSGGRVSGLEVDAGIRQVADLRSALSDRRS